MIEPRAQQPSPVRGKNPLESFRGVMAAALIIEAIAVALVMLVVIKFTDGVTSAAGWAVMALVIALLVTCGLLKYRVAIPIVAGLQVAMIACGVLSVPLAIVGALFAVVWGCLLWMRHDVARRMAAGVLPAQQEGGQAARGE